MADAKETCRAIIAAALNEFIKEKDPQAEAVAAENIVIQNAPNPEMGDLGSPMFNRRKTYGSSADCCRCCCKNYR